MSVMRANAKNIFIIILWQLHFSALKAKTGINFMHVILWLFFNISIWILSGEDNAQSRCLVKRLV